jgi:hypothetical protein
MFTFADSVTVLTIKLVTLVNSIHTCLCWRNFLFPLHIVFVPEVDSVSVLRWYGAVRIPCGPIY